MYNNVMFNEHEYFFQCPYCFQSISMVVEHLYGGQDYIEDCEVCCHPINIKYQVVDGEITQFEGIRLND
jgi:hypothetical protein